MLEIVEKGSKVISRKESVDKLLYRLLDCLVVLEPTWGVMSDFNCKWSAWFEITATLTAQVWAQSRERMRFRLGFCHASPKEEEGEGGACIRGRTVMMGRET